jgi:hypothetical protein
MPIAHSSIVGGSTAARRLGCPGSRELEAQMPDNAGEAAREGTALHSAIEFLLDQPADFSPTNLAGMVFNGVTISEDHVYDALVPALACFDELVGDLEFEVEITKPFPGIEGAFGTADVVVFHPDGEDWQLMIHDWKFGRGHPVKAKSNAQLAYYACCVIEHYGLWDSVKHVCLSICQPRLEDGNSTWVIEIEGLRQFARQLRRAIEGPPDLNLGEWCLFCRGMPICPAQQRRVQAVHQWHLIAGGLAQAMDMVEGVEEWCRSVKAAVHEALEAGQPVVGYKLVAKRTTRSWAIDDDEVVAYLEDAGLPLDVAAPRSPLSPAQAEKALKAKGETLRSQYIRTESSGNTVAPVTDKREPVSGRSNTIAEIEALAAIINR